MKKLLASLFLIGGMSFLVLSCEPVDNGFEPPLDEPMEQGEGEGF